MATDWERRNKRAEGLGYDNYAQRREMRKDAREGNFDELYRNLDGLIAQRTAEEDYQSIGEIFADLYDELPEEMDRDTFLRGIFSPSAV